MSKRMVTLLLLALAWGVASKPSIRKRDNSQATDNLAVAKASRYLRPSTELSHKYPTWGTLSITS
jgi:hypothetical protein